VDGRATVPEVEGRAIDEEVDKEVPGRANVDVVPGLEPKTDPEVPGLLPPSPLLADAPSGPSTNPGKLLKLNSSDASNFRKIEK
jgi:hypothetical protein